MEIISYQTKKKMWEKKCHRPTGHNYGHPLDQKQLLFLGWPDGNIAKDFLPREYQITKASRLPNTVPLSLPL